MSCLNCTGLSREEYLKLSKEIKKEIKKEVKRRNKKKCEEVRETDSYDKVYINS